MRTENLEEYRIRASRLLKGLRASDPEAMQRVRALPEWADRTEEEIREGIRRKHALALIAREAGFRDWPHLKSAEPIETPFDTTRLFPKYPGGFLNLWFRAYEEARAVLEQKPDQFLFPYRHQFVLCEPGMLESLGVDPHDPDWERIGHDWVKPRDPVARARLGFRLRRILG